jgi:hypothetical protein
MALKQLLSDNRFDIAALTGFCGGFIGIIVHGAFLKVPGPLYVFPNVLGVWLAIFMMFFSLQLAYLQRKQFAHPRQRRADLFYYAFLTIVAFLLFIGSSVGYRPDGAVWNIFLTIILGLCTLFVAQSSPSYPHSQAATMDADPEQPASTMDTQRSLIGQGLWKQYPKSCCCVAGLNTFLRVIAFVLFGLLLGGTWFQAAGYQRFPPRGTFVTLRFPDSQPQRVHVWCTGQRNSTRPTFFFEVGGGGHSMSDLYGLQFKLNDLGYRVCQYDVPGAMLGCSY